VILLLITGNPSPQKKFDFIKDTTKGEAKGAEVPSLAKSMLKKIKCQIILIFLVSQ